MTIRVSIRNSSLPHIIEGMQRHGDNYRFRYKGEWYHVKNAFKDRENQTILELDKII